MDNTKPIFFKKLQDEICNWIMSVETKPFVIDKWNKEGLEGGGETRVFENGSFLEKGCVNFSEVEGRLDPSFEDKIKLGSGLDFYATGTSVVMHPKNPFVPTIHCNYRFIKRGDESWFGGGADLTPYYVFEEDCVHFHRTYYDALKPYGKYPEFKKKCDEYFYLPHRNETRGIGGIFFDYLACNESNFEMVKTLGDSFTKSYSDIVQKRKDIPYDSKHIEFQQLRRGRYVEFNLLYDRGTAFGLKTKGRVESILLSLPRNVKWHYKHEDNLRDEEKALLTYLKPINWLKNN